MLMETSQKANKKKTTPRKTTKHVYPSMPLVRAPRMNSPWNLVHCAKVIAWEETTQEPTQERAQMSFEFIICGDTVTLSPWKNWKGV